MRCFRQLYLTDLATRESVLLCTKEHPIQQLALQDNSIWVATTDSSVEKWPAEVQSPQKVFQRGGSFLAGNLSFNRARVSLEGLNPVSKTISSCKCFCLTFVYSVWLTFRLSAAPCLQGAVNNCSRNSPDCAT